MPIGTAPRRHCCTALYCWAGRRWQQERDARHPGRRGRFACPAYHPRPPPAPDVAPL